MEDSWLADAFIEDHDRMVAKMVGKGVRWDEAEDMVDEAFCRAWSSMVLGKGPVSSARGWLWTILRNIMIDRHRRWLTLPVVGGLCEEMNSEPWSMDRELEKIEAREMVALGLAGCQSDMQREVVRLYELGGYSSFEAAEIMGTTSGAVKSARARAVEAMRGVLCE